MRNFWKVSTAVKGFCAKGLLNEAAASLGGDATQQIQSRGAHSPDDASAFNVPPHTLGCESGVKVIHF